MRYIPNISAVIACLAILGPTAPALASGEAGHPQHNTANTVRLSPEHPDSFRNFAPELPKMLDRVPQVNTGSGLHVREIEPGLFFVTDMVYQSAFLVTDDGVVVFDAPPSFAERLRPVIADAAPDAPITHLIMSHGHSDHNGGGFVFADVPGLEVVAAADVAVTLAKHPLHGILTPTRTFDDALDLTIGGVPVSLRTARYHAEDTDTIIHLPQQRFLMAIDTITPGEAPFMNFGATTDVNAYFDSFETFLDYDFDHFLSGHVSVLGTRDDVIAARDYAFDVRDTVTDLMPTFGDRMMEMFQALEYRNANLAYRHAIESVRDDCARQIIGRWQTELSVVDVWADSHCELTVLYQIMH